MRIIVIIISKLKDLIFQTEGLTNIPVNLLS